MTAAKDVFECGTPARLRAAGNASIKPARQPAGPFEVATRRPTMRDALAAGLLVIYPAFAALAAIVAGLFLTGAGSV